VQNFSETDILNYLMTSEFNEGLTPDEFKFLLYRFRYYYRLTYGMNQNLKTETEGLKKALEEKEFCMKKIIDNFNSEKAWSEDKYNRLINRKLTWKERIKGKIIIKEDEIKRI
jgi:hypothetical protein